MKNISRNYYAFPALVPNPFHRLFSRNGKNIQELQFCSYNVHLGPLSLGTRTVNSNRHSDIYIATHTLHHKTSSANLQLPRLRRLACATAATANHAAAAREPAALTGPLLLFLDVVACSSCNIKHARNSTALTAESERVKQPRRRRACRLGTLAVQHLRAQI